MQNFYWYLYISSKLSIIVIYFIYNKKIKILVLIYRRINLLDGANIISNCILLFHDFCLILITSIIFILVVSLNNLNYSIKKFTRSKLLEIVWTIVPIFFLFSLRIPSFLIIYYLERETKRDLTYKRIRHQWYWTYENDDFEDWTFTLDQYIADYNFFKKFFKRVNRLLDVDNTLVLPYQSKIRIIITSTDVLHSWALPTMFIKVDAVPRRLNSLHIFSHYPRSVYGQCSEICRINHSFIPIHIEFVKWNNYLKNLIIQYVELVEA